MNRLIRAKLNDERVKGGVLVAASVGLELCAFVRGAASMHADAHTGCSSCPVPACAAHCMCTQVRLVWPLSLSLLPVVAVLALRQPVKREGCTRGAGLGARQKYEGQFGSGASRQP